MATEEQRLQLRRNTGETDSDTYTDEELDGYIQAAAEDIDLASARIWEEKAAEYAELVDISEAGSSRKNGVLYKNAVAEAARYAAKGQVDEPLPPGSYSTTRKIVRA